MSVIEAKTSAVLFEMTDDGVPGTVTFDPMTWAAIIGAIVALVNLWRDCRKTPENALDSMRYIGILERRKLRQIVRSRLGEDRYNQFGVQVERGLQKVARNCSLTDVEELFTEVSK